VKAEYMASKLTQKTTIYLEPHVKKFLQLRALQQSKSISRIINDRFAALIRDFEAANRTSSGKRHPSVAEWEIVKSQLDKKHHI